MKRPTTPTHIFKVPSIKAGDVSKIKITYHQFGVNLLEKKESDAIIEDGKISVQLTQQETNKFRTGKAEVQLRILTVDGKALETDVFEFHVDRVLNSEVMS